MYPGERFNGYSHLAGLAMSVSGGAVLLYPGALQADAARTAGSLVFVLCAVVLYAASTCFHSTRGRSRRMWQRLDHCSVYLLIAGSYTPFALAGSRDFWGWMLLAGIWMGAALAIASELRSRQDSAPPLASYVLMGWFSVFAAARLASLLEGPALAWLVSGAAAYSVGIYFYRNPRGWRHAHGWWHLCVMAGTACHYMAVIGLGGAPLRSA